MAKLIPLEGLYNYSHPYLFNDCFKFEICNYETIRANSTKGLYYHSQSGEIKFISSLFPVQRKSFQPTNIGIYSFDCDKINYFLVIDANFPNQMEIQKIGIKQSGKQKNKYTQSSFL